MKQIGLRRVWSLEEITEAIARRFADVPACWVEAEVDDLRAVGRQMYFQLRGEHTIDASMPLSSFRRMGPTPGPGTLVHAHGRVEYFRARSRITMRIDALELVGEGLLRARIEELRGRLREEGLLRAGRERPVPLLARRIGLVTSPVGAARDDFIRNARARFARVNIVIAPTLVQGDDAPAQISAAIARAAGTPGVDVVVVTRGGGSLEDLMAFNSETVCRAIARCPVPVVTAVGHERDRPLCDEVADLRVSTPTAAAIAVVPDAQELEMRLASARRGLEVGLARQRQQGAARVTEAERRLRRGLSGVHRDAARTLAARRDRLRPLLGAHLGAAARAIEEGGRRHARAIDAQLHEGGRRLAASAALLQTLSPSATVARGYAIIRDARTRAVLTDVDDVAEGRRVSVELRGGEAALTVGEVEYER